MAQHWTVVLDIGLAAAMLYYVYIWLVRTRSAAIVLGLLALGLVYLAATTFGLYLTAGILQGFYAVALIGVIIIFQPELRRILENVGFIGGRSGYGTVQPASVRALAQAMFDLAEKRVGALIVLPGRGPIGRHLTGGVALDGAVSPQLLASLFDSHSDGHDGAVIIDSERVTQFGCYLPLSQRPDLDPAYGTRHRAALGISEAADCIALVASEETGHVSVAQDGDLAVQRDVGALEAALHEFLRAARPGSQVGSGGLRRFTRRPFAKLGAVAVAAALWFVTGAQPEPTVRALVESPVLFEKLATSLYIASGGGESVRAELEGAPDVIAALQQEPPSLVLDLEAIEAGPHAIQVTAAHFRLPSSVRLLDASPASVAVLLERFRVHAVPVSVVLAGEPADGFRVGQVDVEPAVVRVLHKANVPVDTIKVATEPVDVAGARRDVKVRATLVWPAGVRQAEGMPDAVDVFVRLNAFVASPLPAPAVPPASSEP